MSGSKCRAQLSLLLEHSPEAGRLISEKTIGGPCSQSTFFKGISFSSQLPPTPGPWGQHHSSHCLLSSGCWVAVASSSESLKAQGQKSAEEL